MEKEKALTYESLNADLQKLFLEKAKEQWKQDYGYNDGDLERINTEKLLEEYASNYKTSHPIILQALSEGKKYCEEYISTRDNLALLSSFRVSVTTSDFN
jgi:hypothetical protein